MANWALGRSDVLPAHRIMMAFITAGTALHFVHRGIHRLRRCKRQACGAAFADFSRPGTQRYCSRTCANADAVRRHRQRIRGRPRCPQTPDPVRADFVDQLAGIQAAPTRRSFGGGPRPDLSPWCFRAREAAHTPWRCHP